MIKSKSLKQHPILQKVTKWEPRKVVAAALLIFFAAAAAWAQTADVLSGRDLLTVMRETDGHAQKPAYENRSIKPPKPQTEKPEPKKLLLSRPDLANSTGDQLLQMIPAESLFCVRVNNLDYTLSQIDQFLAGVSPIPMGLSILVRTQFAGILGSPELNGVNMGGSFAFFATSPSGESTETNPVTYMFVGVLAPIADYRQFISANPNVSDPDEKGISKITGDKIPVILATQVGNYALISLAEHYDKLIAMRRDRTSRGLSGTLDATKAEQAIEQPIWAYGNVQLASKVFAPLLSGKIEEIEKAMEQMKDCGQATMADPTAIIDMYAGILEALIKQTKSLTISVNPKPSVLNITSTVTALPGTDMADMFTADASAKKDNKLLGYLEDGAVMNVSGKVTEKLNAKATEFFATLITKDMSAEDAAKIKSFASDAATVFSGNDAMSFSINPKNKPPFVGKYVIEIKDKDKFNKLIEEGAELFHTGGIADFYKSLGIKITFTLKRQVDTYKGVTIDSATFTVKSIDPNSMQGQMIVAIYGGGFDYRWAIVDGLCVSAFGGNVDESVRRLIDQVKAGGPKQMADEVKAALALLPDAANADFIATYNYVRLLKMLPAMMGAMMPVPMPEMDIPTNSNIVFAGKVGGGNIIVDIALPKEHLTEIMAVFQMMMQQQQMQQMPGPPQPTIQPNK